MSDDDIRRVAEAIYVKALVINDDEAAASPSPESRAVMRNVAVASIRAARIFDRMWREGYLIEPGEWE